MSSLGILRIYLLEAKFEHDVDRIGKQDPYVIMSCRENTWQSPVCENGGKHPTWEQAFWDLEVKYEGDNIEIECRDDDVVGSKHIASGVIKVGALTLGDGFDEWFEVQHKGKPEGKIHLRSEWKAKHFTVYQVPTMPQDSIPMIVPVPTPEPVIDYPVLEPVPEPVPSTQEESIPATITTV